MELRYTSGCMDKLKSQAISILRWSEQYTKTDMVYLAHGGFWLGFGYVLQIANGLIIAIAFANLLPKNTFGTYQFILAGASILGTFTLNGIGTALSRVTAQGNTNLLRGSFKKKFAWNVGIAIASGLTALYYYIVGDVSLATSFLIVGTFSPFIEGFNLYHPYLLGKQDFRGSVLLGIWRKPLPIIGLVATSLVTDDPVILIFIYFLSHTISAGLVYHLVVRRHAPHDLPADDLTTYSLHLSIMQFMGRLAENADKILMFYFLGPIPVALYSLATIPINHARSALNIVKSLMLPKLSKRNYETLQKTLPHKINLFSFATLAFALFYVFVAPILFKIIFPEYPESIILSQALAITLLFLPRSAYSQAFIAHAKTTQLYTMRFLIPSIKITLLLFLLPQYGVWGAVYAVITSELIASLIARILFKRQEITLAQITPIE